MTLSPERLDSLDAFLVELNRAAGQAILPLFRAEHGMEDKGSPKGFDPVTAADRGAEAAIRKLIAERFPAHGVIGEEYGADRPEAEFVWVIDPIDGTRAFIAGRPDWTISVALVEDGRPVLAALYAPVTEEMFVALRGQGATRNGVAMQRSDEASLRGARIAGPKRYLEWIERLCPSVLPQAKVHSLALRLTQVGSGDLDLAFASGGSHDWDLAAADLLVHEAGGVLTDLTGRPLRFNAPHGVHGALVAAGPARHRALLDLVGDGSPEFA